MQHTPLYARHRALGGKLVDFAGYAMPLDYGSQIEEHHAVRRGSGVFDVSHMALLDLSGAAAESALRSVLANDVAKLSPGHALYSCMLREDAGILDDLIVYRTGVDAYRLIANAATRAKDLVWLRLQLAGRDVLLEPRDDLGLLALQGPEAAALLAQALGEEGAAVLALGTFELVALGDWLIARTGYTGEDGFEIALPASAAPAFWDRLLELGARACGLGARDTLRLEAGLNLYGADMDEQVTPDECGLAWTVAASTGRDFVGRAALERRRAAGFAHERAGLLLEEPGVMRAGFAVGTARGAGTITSGGYSPTLERSIAFARVPLGARGECSVSIRGRERQARIVKLPFVRRGKILVSMAT